MEFEKPILTRTLSCIHWICALEYLKQSTLSSIEAGRHGDWSFIIEKDHGLFYKKTLFGKKEIKKEIFN